MSDTSTGSALPSMSAADEAAFEAQRTATPEPAPAPAPTAPLQTTHPLQQHNAPAPTAPTTPTLAPSADDVPDARTADDGKRYVPVETLVSTRQTLKGEIRDMKAVLEAQQQQLQSAMQLLAKQDGVKPAPAPAAPATNPYDKNINPIEAMQWEVEQANAKLAEVTSQLNSRNQQEVAARQLQDQQRIYAQHHQQFAQVNPGYNEAYNFLVNKMVGLHRAQGYDENAATQAALQVEWATVTQAVQRNQDPCAVLYNMAREMGFTAPAPAAGQKGADPMKAIKLAQDAASAATSLSGVPGTPGTNLDVAALANMDKKEFDAFFANDPGGKKWEKMMLSA